MARRREVRAFDLFCGGGGSSLGAKQAGATPVGGVDLWSIATDAYAANLPGAKAYTGDLSQLNPRVVVSEVGRVDLLLASPECTHHSVAKGNKPRCEVSKQLAYQVIRFAKVFEPRWIVVENVIQMRSWPSFPDWLQQLHALGYNTIHPTLEAEKFGVPQTRRRMFVICDRQRTPQMPRCYRKKNATVETVLNRAKQGQWSYKFSPLDNGKRAPKTIERAERAIEAVGENQPFIMVYYGSDGAGGFQTLDRPLRTITTLDRFATLRPKCVGYTAPMIAASANLAA
ncbi:MAG: DNA cytosine methyltransferase [Planctomycetota bacterium]|nr:DNA cytosine methyltransferase [Planctomycetota bacterium]